MFCRTKINGTALLKGGFAMQKFKPLPRKILLLLLSLLLLQELLPITEREAAGLQLCNISDSQGENPKSYALRSNGDLVSWTRGPLDRDGDYLPISPWFYVFRRTAARNVISFSGWANAVYYVDRDHVLWKKSDYEPERTRLMEDVSQAAATLNYGFALKTDGSLWSWGNNSSGHLGLGWCDMESYPPQKILDHIRSVYVTGTAPLTAPFAVTEDGTLLYWGPNTNGVPTPAAENVQAFSVLKDYLYQYLTPQGEVYALAVFSKDPSPKRIAEDVCVLFDGGFIKNDHTQWLWEGSEEDGRPVKVREGVQAAADQDFYVDTYGRLHWPSNGQTFPVPPRSVRSLNPTLQNLFLLSLVPWLLYERRQKKNAGKKPDWCKQIPQRP
jgi:hypothetical protein